MSLEEISRRCLTIHPMRKHSSFLEPFSIGACVHVAVCLNVHNMCVLNPPAKKLGTYPAFYTQTPSRLPHG